MAKTKIEWTDYVINPVVGCSKISEGCKNCYAEKMAWRLKCMGISKYQDVVDENGWTGKIGVDFTVFDKLPKKQKKIFVSSMGDLFHENVKWNDQYKIFDMAYVYRDHTIILLTKRPQNLLNYYDSIFFHLKRNYNFSGKYLKNIWLGVTVESPEYLPRVDELLKIPAAVRFVSIEPALDYIDIERWLPDHPDDIPFRLDALNWVIWGPETGPKKRYCNPEWAKKTYDLCKERGVPFFDKTKKNWLAREFPKGKEV